MLRICGFVGVAGMVALSAIITKEAVARAGGAGLAPLATIEVSQETPRRQPASVPTASVPVAPVVEPSPVPAMLMASEVPQSESPRFAPSTDYRYFNGRLIRPVRTLTMSVTAYSPDEKSCGPDARGITSSIHNVGTNAMKLAAADSRVLPLGSMVSIPGYDDGHVIPVLDRGGAIKGHKLDVLFPTDAKARAWGVKKLVVTVWEYADNLPAEDFRAIRDSRK
jgi:3D (Asp-Asp-Asp) domain-containing protein